MSNFLSDIDANTFTISAFLIGFILIDDLDPAEQNSVGNWFMMVGQVLCTNSAQQQVINNHSQGNRSTNSSHNNSQSMESVKRSISTIYQELAKY